MRVRRPIPGAPTAATSAARRATGSESGLLYRPPRQRRVPRGRGRGGATSDGGRGADDGARREAAAGAEEREGEGVNLPPRGQGGEEDSPSVAAALEASELPPEGQTI